jgi:hypothetical protein
MKIIDIVALTACVCLAFLPSGAQTAKDPREPVDIQQAEAVAKAWVQGWNHRDAEAVLSHYAEDVEFQSPLVVKLLGEPTGTVRGKSALREYFRKVLAAFPVIELEFLGAYQGVSSRLVHFQAKGGKVIEVQELNQEGKVRRAITLSQPAVTSSSETQRTKPAQATEPQR